MNLDLTEEETEALLRELNGIIDGDRYFLSPRIKTLKAIRAKIRPGAGAGTVTVAAEGLCSAKGKEIAWWAVSPTGKRLGKARSRRHEPDIRDDNEERS